MINIKINFALENEHGTYVEGSLLLPHHEGIFYKPHSLMVYNGLLDLSHRFNSGISSEKIRDNKELLIKKYMKIKNGFAEIQRPFVFNDSKSFGFLGFASNILGISTNRGVNLKISNLKFNGLILPRLFQNLKPYSGQLAGKVISIDELPNDIYEDIKSLSYLYHANINTASADTQQIQIKEKHEN